MIQFAKDDAGKQIYDADNFPVLVESNLRVPDGRATGALPRTDRPGETGELFHDVFRRDIIDPDDWPELIRNGRGDHRQYINWILDQDGVGSCGADGLCGCVDTNRERRGYERVKFNPWPLYYYSSGGRDQGSSLDANIREARKRGLVPDALWPRAQHRWNDLPPRSVWDVAAKYKPEEVYDIGNTVEAASALFRGHSVYAAYPGHAWQLITVLSKTQALWRNSWGATWDGDGIGVINFSRITFQYGLYSVPSSSAEL